MAVSLQQFIKDERERIEKFEAYWLAEHKKNPEAFPMSLPDDNEGLWHEMLADFDAEA